MMVIRPGELPEEVDRVRSVLAKCGGIEVFVVQAPNGDSVPRPVGPFAPRDWRPDLILALGGDGTVLRALDCFPSVPVLAINFGTVGFLTSGDRDQLDTLLRRLLDGDFYLDERLMLRSTFRGRTHEVVNEVMLKGTTHLITVEVWIDGRHVHTVRGDGLILGTPTGSTAYLLSTGSPIVMPSVECFILASLNEHSFSSRPLVIDPRSSVRVRVSEQSLGREIIVSHDGRDRLSAEAGDELLVEVSDLRARLIFFEEDAFFTNLRARLHWSARGLVAADGDDQRAMPR
jgi:NAD+ kinase